MKEVVGYEDPECANCTIREEISRSRLCEAMVMYTRLQIEAAEKGDLRKAMMYEYLQHICVDMLGCTPGFNRM